MNSLSWMIYAADVVGGLNTIASAGAVISLIAAPLWGLRNQWLDDFHGGQGKTPVPVKQLLSCVTAFAIVAAAIPSSSTIYAIAASEMGETALKSETGGKAVKALNAWLDRQIAPEKGK
jgi:hypothetical protein